MQNNDGWIQSYANLRLGAIQINVAKVGYELNHKPVNLRNKVS